MRILRTRKNSISLKKAGSAVKDLGCTLEFLEKHIEGQFQEGMTWDNYGEWEVDHIVPLAKLDLTNPEDFAKACHYSNLQPLWWQDNLKKSDKVLQSPRNAAHRTPGLSLSLLLSQVVTPRLDIGL